MGRRIRILHVCDKFGVKGSKVHGVSRLFTWWIPRFDAARFDVKLVGLRKGDPAVATLRQAGIDVIHLDRGKYDLRALADLKALVRREDPDILHLHGYAATNFGRLAAQENGARIVVHEHFVDPAMPFYQKILDRLLSRRTDAAIAVSRSVAEFMVRPRHIPADKVDVVFNGAPLEEFRPLPDSAVREERARWGFGDEHRILGAIGRLDEQKGLRYLIEAFPAVRARHPEARLLLVGDGPRRRELEELSRALGIEDQVRFAGYCADVRRVQCVFDIQVFPSLWEGTPLTVFEAMAMARPIVSTDVDGLGEVLRNGDNALVVPPRDAHALAAALTRVLDDGALASALARSAHRDSAAFDIGRTVAALEDLYTRLAAAA